MNNSTISDQEIDRNQWNAVFTSITNEYRGVHARLEVFGKDLGDQAPTEDTPFQGISADNKDGENVVWIDFGDNHLNARNSRRQSRSHASADWSKRPGGRSSSKRRNQNAPPPWPAGRVRVAAGRAAVNQPGEMRMRVILARNWWSLVIRGIAAIIFGILTFVWPGITVTALVFLFAGYALVDGVVSLAGAVRAAEAHDRWGALLLEGIVGIAAAIATILWPGITALSLVFVIAAWAIITGVAEIAAAVRLRKHIHGEWLLALAGILSILFGVLVVAMPIAGALVIAIWIGAYALVFGVTLVALGFRLRSWLRGPHETGSPMPLPAH